MFKVYRESVIAGFTQVANYRSEIWLSMLGKSVQIFLLILFWSVITKSSSLNQNLGDLISYFLVANVIIQLTDADTLRFARQLNDEIRMGSISSYLLRPINAPVFVYTRFVGTQGVLIIITLALALSAFVYYFRGNILSIFLLLTSIVFAMLCAFGLNLIVGAISFWTTESRQLRHVVSHVIRVFGGSIIPLTYFSSNIKTLILLTPLPSFSYIPATLVKGTVTADIIIGLASSIIWSILLLSFGFWLWKKGVKQYESIGI